jgi:DNA-binding response OmpR family regulator
MKLLVVEDDKRIAATLRRGLEAEGFTVDVALDGIDGLWRAAEYHFDLLILDLLLPGKNGFQLCRELRDAGNWTPILILTAKAGEFDETEALDTGADAYLTKPFSFPVLISHVRALLRRPLGATAGPIEVRDLTVDAVRRRCWRAGREVSLTNREFAVLEYLARNAGTVLAKHEILESVWEYDFDGDINIIEVYIRRLRRKLDEPFASPMIQTVRGAGYRLADGT